MKKALRQFGTALLVGFVVAVFIRGLSGCSGSEAGAEGTNTEAVIETAELIEENEPVEDILPEGYVEIGNTICPVMGGAVVEGLHIDWMGFRINICCEPCDQLFREDPKKFIEVLAEEPGVSQEVIEDMYMRADCENMDDCEDFDMDDCEDFDMDNCEDMMPVTDTEGENANSGCCGS